VLTASDRRADAIIAKRPHSSPKSFDLSEIAWELRQQVKAGVDRLKAAAEEQREAAMEAAAQLRFLDRLAAAFGIRTSTMAAAQEAAELAADAEIRAEGAHKDYGRDARQAEVRASYEIQRRRDEQARFDRRPDVLAAAREKEANALIRATIRNGDKEIQRLAERDLKAAQAEVLRRQEEERRRLAIENSRKNNGGTEGAPPPAPRPR